MKKLPITSNRNNLPFRSFRSSILSSVLVFWPMPGYKPIIITEFLIKHFSFPIEGVISVSTVFFYCVPRRALRLVLSDKIFSFPSSELNYKHLELYLWSRNGVFTALGYYNSHFKRHTKGYCWDKKSAENCYQKNAHFRVHLFRLYDAKYSSDLTLKSWSVPVKLKVTKTEVTQHASSQSKQTRNVLTSIPHAKINILLQNTRLVSRKLTGTPCKSNATGKNNKR